jgi:beta-galactosidase
VKFEISGNDFLLNGDEFNIYSGAIHYFRVLPDYWEDRLLKLKLAGFNTVETYVPWNLHEPKPNEYDFNGLLDIVKFLETAKKLGLYAIVRPGPYICAEWDFGGLPAWLLKDKNMRLRCDYAPYLERVESFFKVLFEKIKDLLITNGGNVLAVQIENEYGSYGNDKNYLLKMEKILRGAGVDVLLFTSDGRNKSMISGGTLPHIYKTLNFGSGARNAFNSLKGIQDNAPLMCCEFWCGWFDHFGEKHHTRTALTVKNELNALLDIGASFNFYMFHGGTNFNFWAGANHGKYYSPTITSYDYGAPLTEWGDYTPTYHAIREILNKRQGFELEPLPPPPKMQSFGEVKLGESAALFDNLEVLSKKFESATPESMEHFGQNYGYIYYKTKIKGRYDASKISVKGVHDRAYVYVDGIKKCILDRREKLKPTLFKRKKEHSFTIPSFNGETEIGILVDAMGRVNYGAKISDRKGITGDILIDNQLVFGYEVYTLPFDNLEKLTFNQSVPKKENAPLFLKGKFFAQGDGSSFIHMDGFTKGCVFVNGFNLGRYWNIGPQKALYLPDALLKEENEIIIFEQESFEAPIVKILDKPNLG